MPRTLVQALPGQTRSRVAGRGSEGRGCSRPRGRETADEAEVTLRKRVAAEAEAGEKRAHALPTREGKGSVKASAYREGWRVRGR